VSNQTRWGLFKGFNPHPKEALWEPPHCNRCDGDGYLKESLLPWVDWWSIGAIGYCARCTHFYHVSSAWEQIPGTHLKEERDRLVGHEVTEIELEKMSFNHTEKLWLWHQQLPKKQAILDEVNEIRKMHQGKSEEAVLLSHMLWSLIWNLDVSSEHLLDDFFEFSLAHPQYIEYKGKTVWLGHQLNLAESLERRYPDHVLRSMFAQWEKHRPSMEQFRDGLGFFIPTSNSGLRQYSAEFFEAAESCRMRLVI
jgi:hypothetical protein